MSEEPITDDQSHYEVSLTAGQAFLAFVLLLLSLAASFAFGLMIGRGQGDERLLAQSAPSIVDEAGMTQRKPAERIVELGVEENSFTDSDSSSQPERVKQPARTAPPVTIKEEKTAVVATPAKTSHGAAAPASVPHYAQLLSTGDQKKAETLAAKLIDAGFLGAYVERTSNEKGALFRVRVNFPSEQEARAAEARLKTYSKDVWITRQ